MTVSCAVLCLCKGTGMTGGIADFRGQCYSLLAAGPSTQDSPPQSVTNLKSECFKMS